MSASNSPPSFEYSVAQFALFAMTATVPPERVGSEPVTITFNGAQMPSDSAVLRLAAQPKPVECSASASEGVLTVACHTRERSPHFTGESQIRWIRDEYSHVSDVQLHARSPYGSAVISLDVYGRFLEDYFVYALATSTVDGDEESAMVGAHLILRVGTYPADAMEVDVRRVPRPPPI